MFVEANAQALLLVFFLLPRCQSFDSIFDFVFDLRTLNAKKGFFFLHPDVFLPAPPQSFKSQN